MSRQIFRQVSLDRLSSPEQLDQLTQLTTPKAWVALLAIGALIAVTVGWSVVGTIPERVRGQAILLRSGGVFQVVAPTDGRVTDIAIRVGDVVTQGQVIARLAQPDLVDQVQQAQATVAELEAQQRRLLQGGQRDSALETDYAVQQRQTIEQSIAAMQRAHAALQERMANEEQLVAQGLVTRQTVLDTRQAAEALDEKIGGAEGQLTQLQLSRLQGQSQREQQVRSAAFKLDDARRSLAHLEDALSRTSEVMSPYTGRVLEIMTDQGSVVARGDPVVSIDLTGKTLKDLEAVIYIPSREGKRLKPGMEVAVTPSTVKKQEYGSMLARITYVSDFPATLKGMQRVIKNDQLIATLIGRDAPYEVHADLIPDPETRSTYRWTSSRGPDLKIQSGTLADAEVTVTRRHPIGLVLPILDRSGGM